MYNNKKIQIDRLFKTEYIQNRGTVPNKPKTIIIQNLAKERVATNFTHQKKKKNQRKFEQELVKYQAFKY